MRTVKLALLPLFLLAGVPLGACSSAPTDEATTASTDEELSPLTSCMVRVCYPGEGPHGTTICGYEPMDPPTANAVASGARTSYAIVNEGCLKLLGLYAWGSDDDSALGDGATTAQNTPELIIPFKINGAAANPKAVAAGGTGACTLLGGGQVLCWGTIASSPHIVNPKPAAIVGLPTVTQITHGTSHACALDASGGVWCWGDNARGQLGDASNLAGRATPFAVPLAATDPWGRPLAATKVVAAGNTTCAELQTGLVRCWGDNTNGSLGISTHAGFNPNPYPPNGFDAGALDGSLVGGGHGTFCAYDVLSSQELCWGANDAGQAGVLPATGVTIPPRADAPLPAKAVTPLAPSPGQAPTFSGIGGDHSCWASSNVDAKCFGLSGALGQIGDGTNNGSLTGKVITPAASYLSAITSGESHACALQGGDVYCWGANDKGQVGLPAATASSNQGVQVTFN